MKNKNLKFSVVTLFVVAVTVFSGCKKTTTTGSTDDTNTAAMILGFLYTGYSQVIFLSDPIADTAQSQVKIKWGTNSIVFPQEGIAPGYLAFMDSTLLTPLTTYTLELTSNLGNSGGSITFPDTIKITAPLDHDTLALGQVNCTWTAAQNAQYYDVWYYAAAYNDSSLGPIGNCPDRRVYPVSNSLTIPASYFNVAGATWYYVYLGIAPCSGKLAQVGQTGNMTGDIKGFITAEGNNRGVDFYVGTPTKGAVKGNFADRMPSRKDRINSYLKYLGVNTVVE
ncbi:MAG: hypothetical protein PHX21_01345 [bacterium]|nr:hypothetical protein [bacterium]